MLLNNLNNIFKVYLFIFILNTSVLNANAGFLNQKEYQWLQNLKAPLKIGITEIPNQVLKNGDSYSGFSIDLFEKIQSNLGVEFSFVYFDTWSELVDAGKNREVDIIFSAQKTPKRLEYFDFTDTVLKQKNKIIVVNKQTKEHTLDDLFNKNVAVVDGSAIYNHLSFNYPTINLVVTKTELESLRMVSKKMVDIAISEAVRAGYNMKKYNINNLHISGDINYDYTLRIASRNDIPNINVILDKTLNIIPLQYLKSIQLKWSYIKDKEVFFDRNTLIIIAIFFGLIVLSLIYVYIINKHIKFLNNNLEKRVKHEIKKNREKDNIMLSQSRLAQMGELISMIAHQWRQPLSSLSLINQSLILKYQLGKLDHDVIESFKVKTEKQITQMSDTIDDFRNFFKPNTQSKVFNISKVIQDALDMCDLYSTYNIDISYKHDFEEYLCDGKANELGQAILNIINNAKDALIEHQDENRTIKILLTTKENKHIISIEDNAGGIPAEIQEKIFDPYFSTKKEKNGTGLGLYMVKMIVTEKLNGKINLQNTNDGAMFQIFLPRYAEHTKSLGIQK